MFNFLRELLTDCQAVEAALESVAKGQPVRVSRKQAWGYLFTVLTLLGLFFTAIRLFQAL